MEEEKITPTYFKLIYGQLSTIEDEAPWANNRRVQGQLQLLKMDVRFMRTFCLWLESWDYTSDEESMDALTSLKLIWSKEGKGLSLLQDEEYMSMEDFHSAKCELEEKIQQSKQEVEVLCENYSSMMMMQSRSLTLSDIRYSLKNLRKNLEAFSSYRSDNIVTLKKQIDLLKAKVAFLEQSLKNLEPCLDGKEFLEFLSFLGDFANTVACLTCLYWVKEDSEKITTEMNILHFYMLHKLISSAYDITPLYFGILKSYHVQPSDSFLLGEAVARFVDFFFEHMATTLKDHFLILREGLIFLFTFLIDPPGENAQAEDLIRNQIYALLHEDAYLVLPFDEMKDDFSKNKMLLSDCMIKIDITIAKIRLLYCGFSNSWIRMEVEKMEYKYFVSVQRELFLIEKHAHWSDLVLGQLQLYRRELRFLRVFLLCFTTWDDTDEEIRVRLTSMIANLIEIWERKGEKGLLTHRLYTLRTGGFTNWEPLASELQGKIQLSKLQIEAWWVNLFRLSFRCKPSTSHKILKFLDSILENLDDLVSYKAHEIVLFKNHIDTLEVKLVFLKNFLKLSANCRDSKELEEFNMFVQAFANDAACLTFLCWAKNANDKSAFETNSMFSHMLQKIKPVTPDIARLYFITLEAIYVQQSESILFGQTALSFVDIFLEDQVTPLKTEFQILRDNIVFLLTFLNDPPSKNAQELICSHIDILFWEGVYGFLPFNGKEGNFSEKNVLLGHFMMKIDALNANIRHLYCNFPDSSLHNFPKIISPRFLEFLIHNLKNLQERMSSDRNYVPFAKYKIIKIEEELVSLRPFFNHIFDLQSEMSEAWLEVSNLVHWIEHVVSSCISSWFSFDRPIWYHMAYLSDVFDEIKVVKTKLEKIKENTMYNARCLSRSSDFSSTPSVEARPQEINEIVIGLEEEAKKIISDLTNGSMSRDIVAIVGMGGSGKTTLAKKVYGSVKCNFHVFAFCYVSQAYTIRRLLLDILCDMKGDEEKLVKMTNDDLKHELRKCLSRRKYLIVLDDIWNVSPWNEVKSSFPSDNNGSRVLLTTRDSKVAYECKIDCCLYHQCLLSEVESWDLLQKKVFHNGISPSHLYEVGKLIAKNCKGLPLAVTVIAGLLARTEKNLRWWSEVGEKVISYLSDEGCMKILELSYWHLPVELKPCLLYLGAYPKGSLIRAKQVILLWISEGFVEESKTKSIEDMATEYLHDLVARSLIIVSAKSYNGGIKTFRVHDLIHELLQMKCRDMNFFQLDDEIASSSSSNTSINNHYRVSTLQRRDVTTTTAGSSLSNARSLLFFREQLHGGVSDINLKELRLAQVLDFNLIWQYLDVEHLSSLVHLRHIDANLWTMKSIPSSISNLWNIGSLILTTISGFDRKPLPETFWRMKSLRHVKVGTCILEPSDSHEHEAYLKLDKVVSFSKPILSTGKDVQRLLQRLPAVRKLSCMVEKPVDHDEESIEILDFDSKLESLKLIQISTRIPYLINFPSTLKKLTLVEFDLSCATISAIAELKCLQVLKLGWDSFPESRLEMEDLVFENLEYFELSNLDLVEWNASTESLPSLMELLIECPKLEMLPSCFEEITTLKRIVVTDSTNLEISAHQIQEEQKGCGREVEVSIYHE